MMQDNSLPGQNNKEILQKMFKEVFASSAYGDETLDKYFSPDYMQSVDGKTLDFEHFRQHIRVQKQTTKSVSIRFKTLTEEGDIVFSNHVTRGETVDGRIGEFHVIAEFRFRDGKIVACDELTYMLAGDPQDRDLGSRH